MVKEIIISNIKKKITETEQKKIFSLAKSITSNKDSIKTTEFEYPKNGVREIKFEVGISNNRELVYFLLLFLSFLQDIVLIYPSGDWFSFECGAYNVSIEEEGRNQLVKF